MVKSPLDSGNVSTFDSAALCSQPGLGLTVLIISRIPALTELSSGNLCSAFDRRAIAKTEEPYTAYTYKAG
jgi:hypothetical protein